MMSHFADRRAAGRHLAGLLGGYAGQPDTLVLGLPRGGVPVAYEVARALGLPLDVFVVRKLGVPGHEELAFGAIAPGEVRVLHHDIIEMAGLRPGDIERITARQQAELTRRDAAFRGGAPPPVIAGRTIIVVDDGLATGASMSAAVAALRAQHPSRIVVAVPVGSVEACRSLRTVADEVVSAMTPEPFGGVGHWYADFSQTSDDEVQQLLRRAPVGSTGRVGS